MINVVEELIERRKSVLKRMDQQAANSMLCLTAFIELGNMEWDESKESFDISFFYNDEAPTMTVTGNKASLEKVFKVMRKHGFEPTERPGEEKQPNFSCFWHHGQGDQQKFYVCYLIFTSLRLQAGKDWHPDGGTAHFRGEVR